MHLDCAAYDAREAQSVPHVAAAAVLDEVPGRLTLFAVNRDLEDECRFRVDVRGAGEFGAVQHVVLADDDLHARNTKDEPDRVKPVNAQDAVVKKGMLEARLPKASWNVLRLSPAQR